MKVLCDIYSAGSSLAIPKIQMEVFSLKQAVQKQGML